MSNVHSLLPKLTVNRQFLNEFISSQAPCLALGLVEDRGKICGFLALRSDEFIPAEITDLGFRFGHQLLGIGSSDFEVVLFTFDFYGFGSYNALINPADPVARAVLNRMVESGDYFFFAVNPNQSVTAFRSQIADNDLVSLKSIFVRIEKSKTTDIEYQKVLSQFSKNPQPPGTLLTWVCRSNVDYLDLSKDRFEMTPARP